MRPPTSKIPEAHFFRPAPAPLPPSSPYSLFSPAFPSADRVTLRSGLRFANLKRRHLIFLRPLLGPLPAAPFVRPILPTRRPVSCWQTFILAFHSPPDNSCDLLLQSREGMGAFIPSALLFLLQQELRSALERFEPIFQLRFPFPTSLFTPLHAVPQCLNESL